MKNKIILCMILMAVCLLSVVAVQAGSTVGEITEGQTKIFAVDNVEYEIELLVISETSNEAKFRVNGEITDAMKIKDVEMLADGSKLELRDITDSKVLFYLGRPGPNYDCRGQTGVLKDGEEYAFRISQMQYVIKAEKFQGNFKLKVNGENTGWMYIGTEQIMADGLQIKILDMGSNDITFCMTQGPALATPTTETSKPKTRIDLSEYPQLFVDGSKLNAMLVVGDQAPADDVIASVDITVSFQKLGATPSLSASALASEIGDYNRNIISVGRPCDNAVTAQILRSNGISDYDSDCSYGLKPGQAIVYLFDYNGFAHMLVFGYSKVETRQAARALSMQKMKGMKQLLNFNDGQMPQPGPHTVELYCEDSDGGIEPYKTGQVYIPDSDDIKKKEDTCYVPAELLENGLPNKGSTVESCTADELCYVTETYCSQPESLKKTVIGIKYVPCPNGCKYGACIKGNEEQEAEEPAETEKEPPISETKDKECVGCKKNGACMQFGIRLVENKTPVYCDIDSALKPQMENDKACQNSYECLSNSCNDGVCQSISEKIEGIRQDLQEQKGLLEKIFEFFKKIFG